MQRVLEMMLDAIRTTWEAAAPWLNDVFAATPTWAWASLATLLLAWAALRMLRPTRVDAGAPPEVLLTRATLVADGPTSDTFALDAAFSNLHHEPVQLLRVAAVGAGRRPVVAEVPAIVTARRAIALETDLVLRPGGRGRLDLYLFVPSSPAKAWRLRVPLAWEPFGRRYQAVLLDQSLRAVRRLPEPEVPFSPPTPKAASRSTPKPAPRPAQPPAQPSAQPPAESPLQPSAPQPASQPASQPSSQPSLQPGSPPGSQPAKKRAPRPTRWPRRPRERGAQHSDSGAAATPPDDVTPLPFPGSVQERVRPTVDPAVDPKRVDRAGDPAAEERKGENRTGQNRAAENRTADRRNANGGDGTAADRSADEGAGGAPPRQPRLRFPDRF